MKITLLQTDIIWCQPLANRLKVEQMLASVSDTDLIVLPEMWSTGFGMGTSLLAEHPNGSDTLKWMEKISKDFGAAICGSIPMRCTNDDVQTGLSACQGVVNRFYFVTPDGNHKQYDKRHLFALGGEDKAFLKGNQRIVIEWNGFRILPLICYDLRFPVWVRNNDDYDLMIVVANWPAVRMQAWDTLLRARAIENQSYVAACNRVGSDPLQILYQGGSKVIGFDGEICLDCGTMEMQKSIDLSMDSLKTYRKKYPFLKDKDAFKWS